MSCDEGHRMPGSVGEAACSAGRPKMERVFSRARVLRHPRGDCLAQQCEGSQSQSTGDGACGVSRHSVGCDSHRARVDRHLVRTTLPRISHCEPAAAVDQRSIRQAPRWLQTEILTWPAPERTCWKRQFEWGDEFEWSRSALAEPNRGCSQSQGRNLTLKSSAEVKSARP